MKVFTTATVFFPADRLDEEFVSIYLDRYTVDTSEGVLLNGTLVTLSPVETDFALSTIFPDDAPLTRYRKASIFNGTISPTEVYDNDDPETGTLTGHTIRCGWPEQFLIDVATPPSNLEDLFEGIIIL